MNTRRISGLFSLSALAVLTVQPSFAQDAACEPRVIAADATFPGESQRRGQAGTVVLDLVIDADGQPQQAAVKESSGYLLLDRAAQRSALDHWRFDVSHCARSDLPASHQVAVEFRNEQ